VTWSMFATTLPARGIKLSVFQKAILTSSASTRTITVDLVKEVTAVLGVKSQLTAEYVNQTRVRRIVCVTKSVRK
jgi:hypothetical protein